MSAVKEAVKNQEVFSMVLKDARVKNYKEGELTLAFGSDYKANHFEKYYKARFEKVAGELGIPLTVKAEF